MIPNNVHDVFMGRALELAHDAGQQGEVPVGAVLVQGDQIIGEGFNQCIANHDPSAHAEIVAIRAAGEQRENYRLIDTRLYVTLEPCVMCAGAILNARISNIVFAARDERQGAAGSVVNLLENDWLDGQCKVTAGVMADESKALLQQFFRERR